MTYFCSIGSQILYIFETHGIGQTPSSLKRYLVILIASHYDQYDLFEIIVDWNGNILQEKWY